MKNNDTTYYLDLRCNDCNKLIAVGGDGDYNHSEFFCLPCAEKRMKEQKINRNENLLEEIKEISTKFPSLQVHDLSK